jgi:hypothetical protein
LQEEKWKDFKIVGRGATAAVTRRGSMPTSKNPASYRLSEEALVLIEQLAKAMGLSRTSVIEVAIRQLAKKEGVQSPKEGKRPKRKK